MKPEDEGANGKGMSRAAKKRAKKKKQKNQQEVAEDHDGNVVTSKFEPQKRALPAEEEKTKSSSQGGILKRPKYAASDNTSLRNNGNLLSNEHNDEHGDNDDDAELDDDVVLSEEIQDFLKSDEVKLKDILLLEEKNNSKTRKKEAKKDDTTKENENESLSDNPFEELTAKERARAALNFLLAPADLKAEDFYEEYWEKKALCIQGTSQSHRHRLDGFLSLKNIREMTEKHTLHYGRDMNVTRYYSVRPGEPKRRANIDPPPYEDSKTGENRHVEVDSDFIWSQFEENSATIRLLCPHKHNDAVHTLLSLFETEWGCMVGANAYLTPKGASQGFAPHYDDIEAFCLQLEGRKRWKVYAPKKEERLPRVSSEDFTEDDMKDRDPVMDVVLEPGDMLYMPRGWIHQGITLPASQGNEHSLHLTMSAMQQWAWVDYLEVLMPEALEAAAASETSVSLRTGLPRNFLDYMGAMHDQRDDALPEQLRSDYKGDKGTPGNQEKDKAEGHNPEDEIDAEGEEKRKQIILLQEKFRNDAKKRIMRVAKEVRAVPIYGCAVCEAKKQQRTPNIVPHLQIHLMPSKGHGND